MSRPDQAAALPKAPLPKQDPVAFAFLIAMGLAAAVVTGGALSGMASSAMQDLLRTAGFGRDSDIQAEQRRQAAALVKVEASLDRFRGEIATMKARADGAEAARREAVQTKAGENNSGAGEIRIDLAALRNSLDDHEERDRHTLNAVNKRIDWLETLVYSQDATGSVQPPAPPARRRAAQPASGWFVLHAETGVAVISGKGGTIDVTPGFVIPQLGRVAAIRQQGGRWEVVTEKGTIRER
jgi:hypothetical protein